MRRRRFWSWCGEGRGCILQPNRAELKRVLKKTSDDKGAPNSREIVRKFLEDL